MTSHWQYNRDSLACWQLTMDSMSITLFPIINIMEIWFLHCIALWESTVSHKKHFTNIVKFAANYATFIHGFRNDISQWHSTLTRHWQYCRSPLMYWQFMMDYLSSMLFLMISIMDIIDSIDKTKDINGNSYLGA